MKSSGRFSRHAGSAILVATSLLGCSSTTVLSTGGKVPEIHVATVSGHGQVEVAPDVARLNVGVEARNADVQAAMNEVSARMTRVMESLERLGVAKKDIQTSALSVGLEPPMPPPPMGMPAPPPDAPPGPNENAPMAPPSFAPPAPYAMRTIYQVSTMAEVTIRDLAQVGKVLSEVTAVGANQAWGVFYDIEDREAANAQARQKAVGDAKARASHLASLGDVKLGNVLAIREGMAQDGVVPFGAGYAGPVAPGVPGMPAEPGRVRVEQWVTVVYAIE